ncbi:MAG: FCD domain-containing protein, partial [Myxococcota bacterium]
RLTGNIALGLLYSGLEQENIDVLDEHRLILEAVIAGDEERAVDLMRRHVTSTTEIDPDSAEALTASRDEEDQSSGDKKRRTSQGPG